MNSNSKNVAGNAPPKPEPTSKENLMPDDPILAALRDTQQRLAATLAEAEQERRRRHRAEQRLDQAHRLIAAQTRLVDDLGARPASEAAA